MVVTKKKLFLLSELNEGSCFISDIQSGKPGRIIDRNSHVIVLEFHSHEITWELNSHESSVGIVYYL